MEKTEDLLFYTFFDSIEKLETSDHIISKLAGLALTETIHTDQLAQIRSFCANFQRFSQSPRYILAVIQPEFHFKYVLNTYRFASFFASASQSLQLQTKWPSPLFVLLDHRMIEEWLPLIIEKAKISKIVVMMPCRPQTNYFHDLVLKYAKEVRFIRNTTTIPKSETKEKPYAANYCLVIYDMVPLTLQTKDIKVHKESETLCSILSMRTQFTSEGAEFVFTSENEEDEEDEEGYIETENCLDMEDQNETTT